MQVHESVLSYIPIKDQSGTESGRLYFIATDPGMLTRFTEKQAALLSIFDSLKQISICPDRSVVDVASVVDESSQQFAELIDYICGVRTSETVFAKFKPFACSQSGETWAAIVLEGLSEAKNLVTQNIRHLATNTTTTGGKRKWRKK